MKSTFNTSKNIDYTLVRKNMKNIRIRITGSCKVVVSAPYRTSEHRIHSFVESQQNFILAKLEEFNQQRKRFYPDQYKNGDSFWYLGKETRLYVVTSELKKTEFHNEYLTIYAPVQADLRFRKDMFIKWYKNQANKIFNLRLQALLPEFSDYISQEVRISIRNMLTRWGSINAKRHTMSLSVHLLRCEETLIDYIIMHELCHFAHGDHSKAFYQDLDRHCANRKQMDKRLKEYGLVDF